MPKGHAQRTSKLTPGECPKYGHSPHGFEMPQSGIMEVRVKKGQIYTGIVERVDFPNKGMVAVEEVQEDGSRKKVTCVVKNTLPGQKVTFAVNKLRKGKAEGRLLALEEASFMEKESPCPHFGVCGGCIYLTLPYEEQLKIKEEQVKRLLDNCLEGKQEAYRFEGIKGSPALYEYRNKMEFSFGDEIKDGPLALGMHKRGSFYDIVTVDSCQIVDEDFRRILKGSLDYFAKQNLSFYHRLRHEGYLRHLLVRKGAKTEEILIALVTTSQWGEAEDWKKAERQLRDETGADRIGQMEEERMMEGWKEEMLSLDLTGKIAGLLHITNDAVADVVKSDRTDILFGQDYFYEELLGLKFKISAFSFFQTNSLGAEVLYQTAREYIGDLGKNDRDGKPDKIVFDLYSGTGTIAQLMAPVAKKVIGVEIVEEAVEAAKKNAALNGLSNCEFIAGDVLKVLDGIEERPDFIILDPPRDGIHPKALEKIIDYGVERLIYISCKPTSLVRDLEVFLERGYMVERAVAVDQFPWTGHVETIVLLSHKSPDSHINVKIEFGEGEGKVPLDAIAERAKKYQPKPRITYKMIQEYVEKKYGFRVHTAYIAEVKKSLGLTMYDAPNAVEELRQPRKHPPKEKVEAIKDALKYFEAI